MSTDQESADDRLDDRLHGRHRNEDNVAWQSIRDHAGDQRDRRGGPLPARENDAHGGGRVVRDVEDREREGDVRDAVADRGDRRRREDEPEVPLGKRTEPPVRGHAVLILRPSTIVASTSVSASISASLACARSVASSARRRAPSPPTSST